MKRTLITIILAATAALALTATLTSCKTVTAEEQMESLTAAIREGAGTYTRALEALDAAKRPGYITLTLAKKLKIKDISTIEFEVDSTSEGQVIIAEIPGTDDKEGRITLISAAIDDPLGCGVALDVLSAWRKCKIRRHNTVRAVFYDRCGNETAPAGLKELNTELHQIGEHPQFAIELSNAEQLPECTFIIEDAPVFAENLFGVVPEYFEPLGDFTFVKGPFPNPKWPLRAPVYRYSPRSGQLPRDEAAVALLAYLLN
ncbi:MAG: hypothetical protein K6G79_00345 [Bacteroidales bacterium]|nr:hypothetical protein [Bacteroidales bacterium]